LALALVLRLDNGRLGDRRRNPARAGALRITSASGIASAMRPLARSTRSRDVFVL